MPATTLDLAADPRLDLIPEPALHLEMRRWINPHTTVWHGTTILCLRKGGQVVVAGDGQVTMGQTVVKSNARKLRRLAGGSVIAGFAGATADAITLFERLEGKLEQYSGQLSRACVELAKDWRTDRYLRRLEAMMAVADKNVSLILSGTGDVLEPEDGIIGIGSGGGYALAAARALIGIDGLDAEDDRAPRDGDRRRDLHLHQRQDHHRETRLLTPDARPSARARSSPNSTASSSASTTPSAPSRSRCATAGGASSSPRAARGGAAEEHPDDRPDRLRQDRDLPAPRPAGPGALCQGRGDQVHRGRLCRPRCRADRPRSGRDRDRDDPRAAAQGGRAQGRDRRRGARARRAGRLERQRRYPPEIPQDAARRRARRSRDRGRGAGERGGEPADLRDPRHARRADGDAQSRRHLRQGVRHPLEAEAR